MNTGIQAEDLPAHLLAVLSKGICENTKIND